MKTKGYYVRFNMDDVNLLENCIDLENKGSNAVERIRNITHGYLYAVRRSIKVSRDLWGNVMLFKEKHKEIKSDSFEEIIREIMVKAEKN